MRLSVIFGHTKGAAL